MSAPLYRGVNAPPAPARCAHKGLWFERFFNQYDGDFAIPSDGKKKWINTVASQGGDTAQLNKAADRQGYLCFALGGQSKVFKTDWHFATGLGNSHPVENGFAWHPTLGVPYLTGAAVKGLVRAWMEEWHDFGIDDPKQKSLKDWFGSAHKADVDTHAGAFIFFDAIPLAPVTLACDVMTPHYGKWYESGGDLKADPTRAEVVPADWHDPVPVPFLVVKRGRFLFSVAPRDTKDKDKIVAVMEALQNALEWLGAGAKAAAGYGRFDEDETENRKLATRTLARELTALPLDQRLGKEVASLTSEQLALMFGRNFTITKNLKAEGWNSFLALVKLTHAATMGGWENSNEGNKKKAWKKIYGGEND